MADKQYDVPIKVQRLFEEKQKIRDKMRQYFISRVTSPYSDFKLPNDPAIVRYEAMINYRCEHFKLNMKNGWIVFCGYFLPVVGLIYLFNHTYKEKEKLFRSGQVAYKDRQWKLFL